MPTHDHDPAATRVTTQPPGGFGELSFVKHVKNIGRAYLKQATVLVACYGERIPASKGCGHRTAELRRVSRFIDKALGFAAHASKAASEEVDKRFAKAVRELGKYEEMFDPDDRTVTRRMEEAKEKDLTFLDAFAKLKEKRTDDWSVAPKNRVLPRRLPPANDTLHTTINTINDDVLLSIFSSYRLDDDENWNLQLRWCKLIHVCGRWRHLIYGSPSHLDLHLLCTNGTPVAAMLKHSPPLPLIINYQNTCATMTTEDEEGILLALEQHDRVRRIVLHAPPQDLLKFLTAMNENFLTLERLSILSTSGDDASLVMPKAFQAARLSHLTLLGVTLFAEEPRSLASTTSLVSLTLTDLRASPYVPPEDLAAQLQFVPLLEELSINFSVPIPHFHIQMRGIESPITRATLPVLKRFIFRGVSAYLESLLARISAPCLRKFDVTLFSQLTFALPVLSRFIDATAELRFPVAKINFNQKSLSITISDDSDREEEAGRAQGDSLKSLYVQVSCKPFDWQVSSAAQICNALWRMLPTVEELAIDFYEHGMPPKWRDEVDSRTWCDLLRPFKRVKKLRVGHALTLDLFRALQPDDSEQQQQLCTTAAGLCLSLLLPMLQELVLEEGCDDNAFTAFVDARRRIGCPIELVIRPSRRDPRAKTKQDNNASSRPARPARGGGGYISSQPMPRRSLKLHVPGSYPASPMSRLRMLETASMSPISPDSSSTRLCPTLPLSGVVEQYLERLRINYP